MRISFSIFFIIIITSVKAQFNVIVEDSLNNHLFSSVSIIDNNYIIRNGTSDSNDNRAISFIKTNINGEIIFKKIYSKNGESWYEQKYGVIIQNNLEYITAGYKIDNVNQKPLILKLDENFDTILTKTLILDTNSITAKTIIKTKNNNYLIAGQSTGSLGFFSHITKLDSSFNVLWYKKYGNGNTDFLGAKIIETFDNSIISIGFTHIGTATFKQDWYIVKTDSLGNLEWWKHPGNPSLNDGAAQDIIQTHDSCFVVVGGRAVYNVTDEPKFDGRIMKFDINGNILWDKSYRRSLTESDYDSVFCFFKNVVELDNGNLAVIAQTKTNAPSPRDYNVLYMLNSNGDSLWTRGYCTLCEYSNYGGPGEEYLSTIQKTDDGGFLLGGWGNFYGVFSHPYTQQMILIKTDSLGCDGTEFSCPLVSVPRVVESEESVLVYPNPATNSLTLTLPKGEGINKNTSVFIYDVYGRVVKQIVTATPHNDVLTIQVADLEQGIYFIKIGDITKKFVKL